MKISNYVAMTGCLALTLFFFSAKSQTKAVLFDGTIVAGYVDHGAFYKLYRSKHKIQQKTLHSFTRVTSSLRIKEDKVAAGAPKNAALTPNLGFGLTTAFRHVALQVPLYYNPKTAVKNGEWNVGVGLGYKF